MSDISQNISQDMSENLSILSIITSADIITKIVIMILLLASIWSWAVVFYKLCHFWVLKSKMKEFDRVFWSGQVLDDLYVQIKSNIDNPLSAVFVNAMNECKKTSNDIKKSDSLKIGYKERVLQAMYATRNREIEVIEKSIPFLATMGTSAPFIGLFGTVWGIMHSFQSIAAAKNVTIATVAPGIAEALFATAVGLFVAIPAVIFYNYLISQVDSIYNKIDDFTSEFHSLVSRAIDEEKI